MTYREFVQTKPEQGFYTVTLEKPHDTAANLTLSLYWDGRDKWFAPQPVEGMTEIGYTNHIRWNSNQWEVFDVRYQRSGREPKPQTRSLGAEETRQRMTDIMAAVDERLPQGFGFALIVFHIDGTGEQRANYGSNLKRSDAVGALKEILFRWGNAEDWMKNIH